MPRGSSRCLAARRHAHPDLDRDRELVVTSAEVRAIVEDRLLRWGEQLIADHGTPVVLIGVGHDHARGQVIVVTLDEQEMRGEVIAAFLLSAVDRLRAVQPAAQPDPQWTRGTLTEILKHLRAAHATPAGTLPAYTCDTCEQFIRGLGGGA